MPDGRLVWLPDHLRKWQVPVVVLPGWETRGRADMGRIVGHVAHHDASPAGSDLGFLAAIVNGRAGLPGPLGNLFLPRGTTPGGRAVRVVAARSANHAGVGSHRGATGNRRVVGTEAANNGAGEPWTGWQLDMWPRVCAAVVDGLRREEGVDVTAADCIDHREWAPGRKIDRSGIDPVDQRRRIAVLLREGPTPTEEDPFMALTDAEQREMLAAIRGMRPELDRRQHANPPVPEPGTLAHAILATNHLVGLLAARNPAVPFDVAALADAIADQLELADAQAVADRVLARLAERLGS